MAIREIIQYPDEFLRKTCKEVVNFDKKLHILLDDMKQTMDAANGVGLAAIQVGVLKRVVIIDIGEELYELINPVFVKKSGEQRSIEGCLSCAGQEGTVIRPEKVEIKAFDRNGKKIKLVGEELLAIAICHELDHLDGRIFLDFVVDTDETA